MHKVPSAIVVTRAAQPGRYAPMRAIVVARSDDTADVVGTYLRALILGGCC
jgi:hypothetical protein